METPVSANNQAIKPYCDYKLITQASFLQALFPGKVLNIRLTKRFKSCIQSIHRGGAGLDCPGNHRHRQHAHKEDCSEC